jgi:uncharacterized SAM-binding protein YcdF (DUF218 family)
VSPGSIARALGIGAVTAFVLTAFTPLPTALIRWSAATEHVQPAEAIVVLGASVSADGVLSGGSLRNAVYGIELFRRGLAPLLVLCGDARSEGPVEAEVRAALARELGVPPAAILTVVGARTTRGEADRVAALLRPRGVRRILLVTDPLHLARAIPTFEARGLEPLAAPARRPAATADAPEGRLDAMRWALQELAGQVYYRLVGYR